MPNTIEEALTAVRVAVDELEDRIELELNYVAEMMDVGEFSTARTKIRQILVSINEESYAESDSVRKDTSTGSAS
jgi:hypothetical protein